LGAVRFVTEHAEGLEEDPVIIGFVHRSEDECKVGKGSDWGVRIQEFGGDRVPCPRVGFQELSEPGRKVLVKKGASVGEVLLEFP
jgi:hypothetical protein